jgi:hypothetical protein
MSYVDSLTGEEKSSPQTHRQKISPFFLPSSMAKYDVINAVCRDLQQRAKIGEKKYGERLVPFNNRDGLRDLYEELLDAANYCKQILMEEELEKKIKKIRATPPKKKKEKWWPY